jgi:Uri superfamily endonuclease
LKGIYVLIIRVNKDIHVNIGALSRKSFAKGLYVYVGSAQTNLEQRVKRHLKREKRLFWHIDYLLANDAAEIVKVLYKQGDKTEECKTANRIAENGTPIAGFGCSDCNCKTHLYHIKKLHTSTKNNANPTPKNITLFKRQQQEYVVHQKAVVV